MGPTLAPLVPRLAQQLRAFRCGQYPIALVAGALYRGPCCRTTLSQPPPGRSGHACGCRTWIASFSKASSDPIRSTCTTSHSSSCTSGMPLCGWRVCRAPVLDAQGNNSRPPLPTKIHLDTKVDAKGNQWMQKSPTVTRTQRTMSPLAMAQVDKDSAIDS